MIVSGNSWETVISSLSLGEFVTLTTVAGPIMEGGLSAEDLSGRGDEWSGSAVPDREV